MKISREKLLYPFYILAHPFEGFYDVRHRGKGSVPVALLLIFLFGLSFSVNRRYASFVVNFVNPRSVDSRREVFGILVAMVLFAAANWSVTCLMEGEGRFRDILVVVGYSLLPMVLVLGPATIISWFIAANEEGLYHLLVYISIFCTAVLMTIGIMTIHNYGFGKTLITMVFTFAALLLIIFIILLLVFLAQQVLMFLQSVYTELILRL